MEGERVSAVHYTYTNIFYLSKPEKNTKIRPYKNSKKNSGATPKRRAEPLTRSRVFHSAGGVCEYYELRSDDRPTDLVGVLDFFGDFSDVGHRVGSLADLIDVLHVLGALAQRADQRSAQLRHATPASLTASFLVASRTSNSGAITLRK